jgi:hypothetical protein
MRGPGSGLLGDLGRALFPCQSRHSALGSSVAISSGTFEQHFESLQIVIHGLPRNLADQRVSEGYDILFCDLADGFIRPLTEKLHKLPETWSDRSPWWMMRFLPSWPSTNRLDIL